MGIYFFHNPLSFHKEAMPAAKAALAALQQGRFWDYHDKVFENMRTITPANLRKWAKELDLDMARFDRDVADPAIEHAIEKQRDAMVNLGARGTPGFFVNGEQIKGARPFQDFKAVIDRQLNAANELTKSGMTNRDAWKEVSRKSHPGGDEFVRLVVEGKLPGSTD